MTPASFRKLVSTKNSLKVKNFLIQGNIVFAVCLFFFLKDKECQAEWKNQTWKTFVRFKTVSCFTSHSIAQGRLMNTERKENPQNQPYWVGGGEENE